MSATHPMGQELQFVPGQPMAENLRIDGKIDSIKCILIALGADMTINIQRAAALKCLAKTGMWRNNYKPPLLRLLWRLGLNLPPPHFAGFVTTALFSGGFFALLWGLMMWFLTWSESGMSPIGAATAALFAGVLSGLMMASYYSWGRRKHRLPEWKNLLPKE